MKLHWIFNRFMKPDDGGEGGGGGGGGVDRGDDFTPTGAGADADDAGKKDVDLDELDDPKDKDEELDDPKDKDEELDDEDDEPKKDKPKRKDDRIPLSRHKAVLDKERAERRALETELARYKQAGQIADANKDITEAENALVALEDKYEGLLADGKLPEAKAVRSELRAAERDVAERRAALNATAVQARAVESVRYDMTVERLEEAYPQINPDHEDFDKAKTGEVLDLKEAFVARGETPSRALQKAVKYVFPAENRAQRTATEAEARVSKEEAESAAKAAEKRTTEARKRNADAATKQPASTTRVGMDHDKAGGKLTADSVLKMDYDSFKKLGDKDLAELRGDIV